jgi:hypothetical protein
MFRNTGIPPSSTSKPSRDLTAESFSRATWDERWQVFWGSRMLFCMAAVGRWSFWATISVLLAGSHGCASGDASTPSSPDAQADDNGDPSREPVLDGGGGIAPPQGGADLCPAGRCNYRTGAGCNADGGPVSCVPLPTADGGGVEPACEAAGSKPIGTMCVSWTDCEPGAVCAGGYCRKLCCGKDWTGCPTGEHCLRSFSVQLSATQTVDSKAYVCVPVTGCNALDPASCASIEKGTACVVADGTGATTCEPEASGGAAEPCPCKGGFACVSNQCRRLCAAVAGGGTPACQREEGRCVHFDRDPTGVGECTPTM